MVSKIGPTSLTAHRTSARRMRQAPGSTIRPLSARRVYGDDGKRFAHLRQLWPARGAEGRRFCQSLAGRGLDFPYDPRAVEATRLALHADPADPALLETAAKAAMIYLYDLTHAARIAVGLARQVLDALDHCRRSVRPDQPQQPRTPVMRTRNQ